jgi:hypothetical protein
MSINKDSFKFMRAYMDWGMAAQQAKDAWKDVEELIREQQKVINELIVNLQNADTSDGYCCCGDLFENHDMGSGHAPVDMGEYHAHQTLVHAESVLKLMDLGD